MKYVTFICVSFFAALFISCKDSSGEIREEKKLSSADTAKSDFLKKAERDPKNYVSDCKMLYREARRNDSILLTDLEASDAHANSAITAFLDYAYYCKNDSLAPVYLIKTAMVAKSINNIPQAKAALDKCISDYSEFKRMDEALFLLAQLYDEPGYLNSEVEAQKLYNQIIEEYPKSPWATSAKGALKMIGKSDKELMEELKKKSK